MNAPVSRILSVILWGGRRVSGMGTPVIVSLVFPRLTGEDQESARRSAALAVAVAVVVIVRRSNGMKVIPKSMIVTVVLRITNNNPDNNGNVGT